MTPLRWGLVVAITGVCATAADRWFHAANGVVIYPTGEQPVLLVFAIMATGGVAAVTSVQQLHRIAPFEGPCPGRERLAVDAAWLLAAYAATGFFASHGLLVTAGLSLLAALRVRNRGRVSAANALATAIVGPIAEAGLIYAGLFQYDPALLGQTPFPAWLPALYLHAGLTSETAGRFARDGTWRE